MKAYSGVIFAPYNGFSHRNEADAKRPTACSSRFIPGAPGAGSFAKSTPSSVRRRARFVAFLLLRTANVPVVPVEIGDFKTAEPAGPGSWFGVPPGLAVGTRDRWR